MLSRLLSKFFYTKKLDETTTEKDTAIRDDLCSILVTVDKSQQYYFEVKWCGDKIELVPSTLSNLLLGVSYGFFTEELVKILREYQTDSATDKLAISETLQLFEQRKEILGKVLSDNRSNDPIVKPSEVFKE